MRHAFIFSCVFCAGIASDSSAAADDGPGRIGEAVKDIPIFDAHIHYKEPAWDSYPVDIIIELMDESDVAMGLVSSTPDVGTIRLWDYAPNRIVPELRPYHRDAGSSNWTRAPGMEAYLAERLEMYPHEGIGEFHIHRLDTSDEALFRAVIEMAKARDISVTIALQAFAVFGMLLISVGSFSPGGRACPPIEQ